VPWAVLAASIAVHGAVLVWLMRLAYVPALLVSSGTVRAAELLPVPSVRLAPAFPAFAGMTAGVTGAAARRRGGLTPRLPGVPAAPVQTPPAGDSGSGVVARRVGGSVPIAAGFARIGPAEASGKLWVAPLPDTPRELAARVARTHAELADSAVKAIIQAFLDSLAMDPAARAARPPDWTTTIAGSKFGLDSKWIYLAGLKIPTAVLALLPLPHGNDQKAFDRSDLLYRDLRAAAQRSENMAEFKQAIREIRERKEAEREFEKNQRTPPPDITPEDPPK
jgi:hypothetical protein